jgi:hypothetical protein
MISSQTPHAKLLDSVAERYRRDGFQVITEPGPGVIPFDLGGYAPDLIAQKENLKVIVEIKTQADKISFDHLSSIADEVKRHDGWRFVLVTSQDIPSLDLPGESEDRFSWEDVVNRIQDADRLSHLGQGEAAYLILWIEFERMMRFHAQRVALPVDRLAPSILIRQLYSQGELSMAQYDAALACQGVRNRIVHGFRATDLSEAIAELRTLVQELLGEWPASRSEP